MLEFAEQVPSMEHFCISRSGGKKVRERRGACRQFQL